MAMDDDFNTPVAVSVLFDLARLANQLQDSDRAAVQNALLELAGILGLHLDTDETDERASEAGPFIDLLIELREQLRAHRQWELADSVRDRLVAMGVAIEDTADGSTWRWRR